MDATPANTPFIVAEQLLKTDRADPAGESLDASGEVDALINLASGTPETEVAGRVVPAREPDWPAVEERARELLDRSVDVRLLIVLACAVLRTRDVQAFADCLRAVAVLVADHWESWHPYTLEKGVLDVEERQNAVAELRNSQIIAGLRALRPFAVPALRTMTVASLLADGDGKQAELPALETALSEAAALNDAARVQQALKACVQAVARVTGALEERSAIVDLSRLAAPLSEAIATLEKAGAKARGEAGQDTSPHPAAGEQAMASADTGGTDPGGFSRESAKRVLQQMIDHFVRVEPSSPVPLYLKRAQGLIGLEFGDVVREMGDDVRKFSET